MNTKSVSEWMLRHTAITLSSLTVLLVGIFREYFLSSLPARISQTISPTTSVQILVVISILLSIAIVSLINLSLLYFPEKRKLKHRLKWLKYLLENLLLVESSNNDDYIQCWIDNISPALQLSPDEQKDFDMNCSWLYQPSCKDKTIARKNIIGMIQKTIASLKLELGEMP